MCEDRELDDKRGLQPWCRYPTIEQVKMREESEHGLAWIHVAEYQHAESSWFQSGDARNH
jgi:hypothetical protein